MNKTTEALKLAKKALQLGGLINKNQALAAIREALAEKIPEWVDVDDYEEPVKLIEETKMKPIAYLVDGELRVEAEYSGKIYFSEKPLYDEVDVRQDERTKLMSIELTDDDILEADKHSHGNTEWVKKKAFSHALINAFKHKNAAAVQPVKQEPVAWIEYSPQGEVTLYKEYGDGLTKKDIRAGWKLLPLYTAPVDAKAIRAEALEEAAKVVLADAFAMSFQSMGQYRTACAAAIRGLK
jgi:hypothetical protein